jgi:hypothetical protein
LVTRPDDLVAAIATSNTVAAKIQYDTIRYLIRQENTIKERQVNSSY